MKRSVSSSAIGTGRQYASMSALRAVLDLSIPRDLPWSRSAVKRRLNPPNISLPLRASNGARSRRTTGQRGSTPDEGTAVALPEQLACRQLGPTILDHLGTRQQRCPSADSHLVCQPSPDGYVLPSLPGPLRLQQACQACQAALTVLRRRVAQLQGSSPKVWAYASRTTSCRTTAKPTGGRARPAGGGPPRPRKRRRTQNECRKPDRSRLTARRLPMVPRRDLGSHRPGRYVSCSWCVPRLGRPAFPVRCVAMLRRTRLTEGPRGPVGVGGVERVALRVVHADRTVLRMHLSWYPLTPARTSDHAPCCGVRWQDVSMKMQPGR